MTFQEIYDLAANGLMAQGAPSLGPDGQMCAYRGTEGRKCAIGFAIPDAAYLPDMEAKSARALLEGFSGLLAVWGLDHVDAAAFLGDLQDCHDRNHARENFRHEAALDLIDVANRYRLTAPASVLYAALPPGGEAV